MEPKQDLFASLSGITLLWEPLFQAAAQTLVGALGTYTFSRVLNRFFRENTYAGAMDLWQRGIHGQLLHEGDRLRFDGLISPFTQLFPGDPLENGRRWNALYNFSGKVTSAEYQSMEFVAGSDAALRVGSINGETLVGLYSRYGFVGEGLVGVAPTRLIEKSLPDFFHPRFVGSHARIIGRLARCPSQHAFVAQAIARKARIEIPLEGYKNSWYVQISSVRPYQGPSTSSSSLLGSLWATTELTKEQYLVQYGYLNDSSERARCLSDLQRAPAWSKARVFCDDIDCPSANLSFKKQYLW